MAHRADLRESQFAFINPDWSWSCPVRQDEVTKLQSAVALVSRLAEESAPNPQPGWKQDLPKTAAPQTGQPASNGGAGDPVLALERLAELHRGGALSDEEYAEAKAAQFRRMSQ